MGSFLESCRNFCQPAQKQLESWVSGVPSDIVWSLAKSSTYSFTACIILTRGDVVTGIKSVVMTTFVLTIYTLAKIIFDKMREYFYPGSTSEKGARNTWNAKLLLISLAAAFVLSQRSKLPICANETVWVAGIPLVFGYRTVYTPLIGVFPCP